MTTVERNTRETQIRLELTTGSGVVGLTDRAGVESGSV